ncbi:MAG: 5-(carboxyamino)imidazole ribonucleotide mutase [bacterium]|nr:5-(carboxyamino)imidazole ribonucleotide mutase [bacterium]
MSKPRVTVVIGSDSDWPIMELCVQELDKLGIACSVEIMSSHRSPDRVRAFARSARDEGLEVIIAAAGLSAALAGTIAANTRLPVIGVPLVSGPLQGVDALLSTVQMPPGVPVATVGIGSIGAKNAALLAAQIIATHDPEVDQAIAQFKEALAQSVDEKSQALRRRLAKEREA